MKINTDPTWYNLEQVNIVEKKYKAKYICEMQVIDKNNEITDLVGMLFYQENPLPEHNNWFMIYENGDQYYICNGDNASKKIINAMKVNDEYYYSHYRHDFIKVNDSFIDGGLNYIRLGGKIIPQIYKFKITSTGLELIDGQ